MKWKFALSLSLILNAALLVVQWQRRPAPAPLATATPSVATKPPWLAERTAPAQPPPASPTAPPNLETEDYPTFIAKLRAVGLSERTIATLVVAEMQERTREETATLEQQYRTGAVSPAEYMRLQWQLQDRQETDLESLLGVEAHRRYQIEHNPRLRELAATGHYTAQALATYYDLRRTNRQALRKLLDQTPSPVVGQERYRQQVEALRESYYANLTQALGPETAQRIVAATEGPPTALAADPAP